MTLLYPKGFKPGDAGASLAAGNFDGLHGDDLAIGAPFERMPANDDTYLAPGGVSVFRGYNLGFDVANGQSWNENTPGIADTASHSEMFGSALAVGDFNNDGKDDLAIGVRGEDFTFLGQTTQNGIDLIGNISGATFQQLTITQVTQNTEIKLGNFKLAILQNVQANTITANDFVTMGMTTISGIELPVVV